MTPRTKVTINKQGIARMAREIQKEFDKHPITVAINVDEPDLPTGFAVQGHTTINYGPVIHGSADSAQLAWNNSGTVNQAQNFGEQQIAPGFELLAQALISTREGLTGLGLADEDLADAQTAADDALAEVTQSEPDRGKLRRAVAALKGLLAPIATGLTAGASEGAQGFARTAIEQLGSHI
ncbi:hypothetical protein B0I32_1313 [Nonomuraea fuscirosea]|uniref:Uncharacterized protein n=1 Tax=Nonomuraea fuscirosea TaxID=1291556 RepID=A0A2T0M598_9ACTN|nr:hypothetical protein B0I32_1313 [Nonomuraea fuscirosea]